MCLTLQSFDLPQDFRVAGFRQVLQQRAQFIAAFDGHTDGLAVQLSPLITSNLDFGSAQISIAAQAFVVLCKLFSIVHVQQAKLCISLSRLLSNQRIDFSQRVAGNFVQIKCILLRDVILAQPPIYWRIGCRVVKGLNLRGC